MESPENMVDIEDLSENDFMIACYENSEDNKYIVYSWKGSSVFLEENICEEYIKSVKGIFFDIEKIKEVKIIEEVPYSESDEFINLL